MYIDEVENNLFYQFPQWLLEEPYNTLSDKAKLVYMLLFDRRSLSVQNKWFDENGKVYMYFTNEQFMEILKCSNKTIVKAKKELHDLKLLNEVRQGINKPNRLYINGSVESTRQEVYKVHTINTNNINTNISNYDDKENRFFEQLENLWGKQFNGYEVQKMNYYLLEEKISNDLLKKAIEVSLANGARNMNYISAVLDNWIDNNITTIEQVESDQKLRKSNKEKGYYQKAKGQRFSQAELDELKKPDPKYGF
ncbi:DnaD and phage-associated domain-containing protein [Streptococcus urinalis FB127-CNA-2]|uniref:DnaD domain protein n=1 Tax=Streptococcus urinalis TaxID=149016 RepID=UPI000299144E|nr:DnaD domain protein [Streptococcus urinalis]EKS21866.1 DnaD and phage-associated domain-containing protein [Streptococcus urinalis FB127-CNA-2]QBX31584.1 putative replication protein [Streptococcus phage Javan642]QBX31671.1 putative replication protein [Streptococcus phage Javan648]